MHEYAKVANVLCNAFTPTHKVLDFKHSSQ